MTAQTNRRRNDRPLAAREQQVVDAAVSGTLTALGIADAAAFRAERPEWLQMLDWFRTMQAKDKAWAAFWHRAWELISKVGFEEGVRWVFRTIAAIGTLLVFYWLGHWFAISTGLLKALLG